MRGRAVLVLVILVVSIVLPLYILQPGKASTTIIVPDDYATIQSAVENASSGDTIFVKAGTYHENVVVSKSLSLIGENRTSTIIDANGFGHVIEITANNVTISGFTITNSGCGCSAKSGLYLVNVQYVDIINNHIVQNGYGIRLDLVFTIRIANNTIMDNVYDGIYLDMSNNTIIRRNNIRLNEKRGIFLSLSNNNSIFHNNFTGNDLHVVVDQPNTWDAGYPSGGNYWSDYNGADIYGGPYQNITWYKGDGLGDTPYIIDANNQDNYPLMNPYSGEITVGGIVVSVNPLEAFAPYVGLTVVLAVAVVAGVYGMRRKRVEVNSY